MDTTPFRGEPEVIEEPVLPFTESDEEVEEEEVFERVEEEVEEEAYLPFTGGNAESLLVISMALTLAGSFPASVFS